MTSTTKKAAPSKKGAAARSERKDEPRTIEFRGLTLELPATLPATVAFDMAELESNNISATAVIRLLTSMIGISQIAEVRNKVADDGDQVDQLDVILTELVETAFAAYGMVAGESPASAES